MSCPYCNENRAGRFDAKCDGCTARRLVGLPKHMRIATYRAIYEKQGIEAAQAMKAAVEKLWRESQTKGVENAASNGK
jgi:hypothetical protein